MKKNIFLSALLLASLNLAADVSSQKLTVNGDLDGEGRTISNWRLWQARSNRGSASASGGIVKLVRVHNGAMYQEINSAIPGEKYVFTVKARANGNKVTPTASIQLVDANDKIIRGSVRNGVFGEADADNWRTAKIEFTTPAGQDFAVVRVLFGSSGPEGELTDDDWCEFDSAELVSAAPAGILNKNSDLDGSGRNLPHWRWWRARGTKSWVRASNGTVRLVHSANSSMHQDVKNIQPGKTYTFTVKARVKGDTVTPTMVVYMVDANDKILNRTVKRGTFGKPGADGWQIGEIIFTAPENQDFAAVRLLFGSSGTGEIPNDHYCEFDSAELKANFGADSAVERSKIDAVMKGEIKEAKASWWGFDPADSTKALQAAINSRVPRLVIDKQSSPWITNRLFGVSNQTIVFEEGAEIQAKKGLFKDVHESQLFNFSNVENVAIIGLGKGGIMRMHKKDYQNKQLYRHSEWRNALNIRDSKNIRVENMLFASSGGDGIYLNNTTDVYINNVVCDDNHRQGMSIIAGENILVENSKFINTSGTSPQSGIDIEPNKPGETLKNIVFRNCLFANNVRWGILLAVPRFDTNKTGPMGIRFENCEIKNNDSGEIYVFTHSIFKHDEKIDGTVEFINCTASNDSKNTKPRPAVEFSVDLHHQMNLIMKNFTILRGGNKEAPLRINFRQPPCTVVSQPQSKVVIQNVKFPDSAGTGMLKVIDHSFSGATNYISGNIVDENGRNIALADKYLKKVVTPKAPKINLDCSKYKVKVAAPADGKMEKYPAFYQFENVDFWVYAQPGQKVAVELEYAKTDHSKEAEMTLVAPDGKTTALGTIKPKENKVVRFTAGAQGFYHIKMSETGLRVAILKSNAPAGLVMHDPFQKIRRSTGTLYFSVPRKSPGFSFRVWCLYNSIWFCGVKFVIKNPAGEMVLQCDSALEGAIYNAPKAEANKGGIYQVTFSKTPVKDHVFWDYNILASGASPYVGLRADRTPVLE